MSLPSIMFMFMLHETADLILNDNFVEPTCD